MHIAFQMARTLLHIASAVQESDTTMLLLVTKLVTYKYYGRNATFISPVCKSPGTTVAGFGRR